MSQDPPDEFDPLKLSKWSLPMVAAWIIWRNPEVVRAAWPKYRREVKNGKEDFFGSPAKVAVSLFDVLAWAADTGGQSAIMQGAAAQRELWHRLDNKELAAVGIPASENEARLIVRPDGTSEWSDDDPLFYLDQEGWPVDAIGRQFDKEPRYTQVRVLRDDVLKIRSIDERQLPGSQTQSSNIEATATLISVEKADIRSQKLNKIAFEGIQEAQKATPKRSSAKKMAILRAISDEFPDGIPSEIIPKVRNERIRARIISNGHTLPNSDDALKRAVERVLKSEP